MSPRISAVVNTYNHERYIGRALQSIIDQDFPSQQLEAIVVDDGSTDSTLSIIKTFGSRVHCIGKPNGGQVSAFHAGVAKASGEIIAFLDGDDWWAKDKLSRVVKAFDSFPQVAAVGHGYYETDEEGRNLATILPESECEINLSSVDRARFAANMRIFGGTSRMALRRSVLERLLPVPSEFPFFDNFLFTQAMAISGAVLLQEPLCYYRLHSANLYASESQDLDLIRRKYFLQKALVQYLSERLSSLGVPPDVVSATLESDRVGAERLRLLVEGGWPWETLRVERADFAVAYRNPTPGYKAFKSFALLLTLLMPPRTFYRLRRWYTEHNLRHLRERFGNAELAVPDAVRRLPSSEHT